MQASKYWIQILLAVLAVLTISQNVHANDFDDDQVAPNEEILKSGNKNEKFETVNDLDVQTFFLNNPFRSVPAGENLDLTVQVSNENAENGYTIKDLTGFMTDSGNVSHIIKNLTSHRYNQLVPSNEKVNLTYRIRTAYEMLPQEVGLIVVMRYSDSQDQLYRAIAYNGKITIVEPLSSFDLQDLGSYVFIVAFFGGILYFVKQSLFPSLGKPMNRKYRPTPKPKTSNPDSTTSSEKPYDEDWIPAHHLKSDQSSKSPKMRKRKA